MNIYKGFFAILFITTLLANAIAQGDRANIISLRQGSAMITTPPSYKEVTERNLLLLYSPGALFDESSAVWCSKEAKFPISFVVELVEEYDINDLVFNNNCENYPGIETKDVEVEFSTTSATSGFKKVANYSLEKGKTVKYSIAPTTARWIKLTIKSNHGNAKWVELAEFEAWGSPTNPEMSTIDIDGSWSTNWQNISYAQSGNTFTGKYAYSNVKGQVSQGKLDRNIVEFYWKENNLEGTAKLYMNREGNRLSGVWQSSNNAGDFGLWTMTRKKSQPIIYEDSDAGIKTTSDEPPVIQFDGEEVAIGETVVLDNVLFVQSKSVLLPQSLPELNKLVQLLSENDDLKVELSGHTDNTGSKELNMKLSDDRVKTVEKYLSDKGIAKNRISGKGFGPKKPLNDNKTEADRKLNRRVEFVLNR